MMYARSFVAVALVGLAASAASADTIATFADPSPSGATPLFTFNGSSLVGGWTTTGLTLQTPVLPAPDYSNAHFSMSAVPVISPIAPGTYAMGPGAVNFFDSLNNPLLTISFSGGILNTANFGSSDFIGQAVTFSGPLLGGNVYTNEAFAFSFANQTGIASEFTATSSFTSSADLVPAPGAAVLLGLGGISALRRRR